MLIGLFSCRQTILGFCLYDCEWWVNNLPRLPLALCKMKFFIRINESELRILCWVLINYTTVADVVEVLPAFEVKFPLLQWNSYFRSEISTFEGVKRPLSKWNAHCSWCRRSSAHFRNANFRNEMHTFEKQQRTKLPFLEKNCPEKRKWADPKKWAFQK